MERNLDEIKNKVLSKRKGKKLCKIIVEELTIRKSTVGYISKQSMNKKPLGRPKLINKREENIKRIQNRGGRVNSRKLKEVNLNASPRTIRQVHKIL